MSYSRDDLAALDAAIASGTLEVSFDDRAVKYRSMNELLKARRHVYAKLNTSTLNPRHSQAVFSDA